MHSFLQLKRDRPDTLDKGGWLFIYSAVNKFVANVVNVQSLLSSAGITLQYPFDHLYLPTLHLYKFMSD